MTEAYLIQLIGIILVFSGGVAILIWWRFNLCAFLEYWLPPLESVLKVML